MSLKPFNTTIMVLVIAAISITIGIITQQSSLDGGSPSMPDWSQLKEKLSKTILLPSAKDIDEFTFIDHNNQAFTNQQLIGKWSILFFAFTNCPDVCPTTLQTLKQVKTKLSAQNRWDNYQVVMVTVDPERDTVEKLASYVPFFDPRFIGIRSDVQATSNFAKQLGILFIKRESDSLGNYDVDHGAALILMNPKGQMAGVISAPHKADEISPDLIALADFYQSNVSPSIVNKQSDNAYQNREESKTQPNNNTTETTNILGVSNAWIRPAPRNAMSMAAYYDIHNNTDQDIVITDVSSPDFDVVMIHDTVLEDGIASMKHLARLVIPANSSVSLTPNGKHMMLMQAQSPLSTGDSATFTFSSDDQVLLEQRIEVKQMATE